MKNYCSETIQILENKIQELNLEFNNQIQLCEVIIELIMKKLEELKRFVLNKGFASEEEEIYFFKYLKPTILSKLIYYNSVYRIETKKPFGNDKTIKKYLKNEVLKLKRYFDNNLEFYKYYRTNSTYLDHKYFVRGNYDIKLCLDNSFFELDRSFSTSHDLKVAKIIANDLIQVYLEGQLYNSNVDPKCSNLNLMTWTGSKTALIELIYALHSQGVIDNGNTDLKVIAKITERVFDIDLGDFYHTFTELKSRKINRTKFIDSLRETLIKRMDDQENID